MSDIFNKYAALAIERGLISESESTKEKLEKNPRWDSQDISAVELLYGVKPDSPKEMNYDRNIVEIAHPNSVIVSPAHDKLNGLVENINERNNIMINIVNKPVDGHLTGRKYAENELVLSLVRIANDMDNKDIKELRILADACIDQIHKSALPAALTLLGGPYTIAAAAILGGVYLQQHLDMADQGFEENAERLVKELEDFIGDHLIGTDYTENFQETIKKIIERIHFISLKYSAFKDELEKLQAPKDLDELQKYVSSQHTDFHKIYADFSDMVAKANSLFDQVSAKFQDQSFKSRQMKDVGVGEKINRFFGGLFSGDKYSLVADDFKDVLRALEPFRKSIASVLDVLKTADAKSKNELDSMQMTYKAKKDEPASPGSSNQNSGLTSLFDLSSMPGL